MRFPTKLVLTLAAAAVAVGAYAQPRGARSDQALIRSATTAAPRAVGAHAAIVAMNDDGSMRSLRAGTNGFTCMADNPVTPGPDPMCMDSNATAWVMAWVEHRTPAADRVGLTHKGRIAEGADADLALLAPDEEFTVDLASLAHKNPVSAYAGRRLRGVVRQTYLRGVPVDPSRPRGLLLQRAETGSRKGPS